MINGQLFSCHVRFLKDLLIGCWVWLITMLAYNNIFQDGGGTIKKNNNRNIFQDGGGTIDVEEITEIVLGCFRMAGIQDNMF